MPEPNRNDSVNLKHRLTGAAILIGFAVVILPILLNGPGNESDGQAADVSGNDTETRVFRSNITPIGGATPQRRRPDDGGAVNTAAVEPPSVEDDDPEPVEQSSDAGAPAPEPDPAAERPDQTAAVEPAPEADDGTTQPAENPQPVDRGWIVQVGTFKNPDNVNKLVTQLKNNGFGTSTTEVETAGGGATRVWVGPFETRVEAARIKTRVKQRTGSEGLIVAYP